MNDSGKQTITLKFPAVCTLKTVCEHHQMMLDAIHKSHSVALDLTDIQQVDAAFIQLLLTAQLEAKRFKTSLEIKGESLIVNELATHIFCHVSLITTDSVSSNGE